jgi:hypothetical protein
MRAHSSQPSEVQPGQWFTSWLANGTFYIICGWTNSPSLSRHKHQQRNFIWWSHCFFQQLTCACIPRDIPRSTRRGFNWGPTQPYQNSETHLLVFSLRFLSFRSTVNRGFLLDGTISEKSASANKPDWSRVEKPVPIQNVNHHTHQFRPKQHGESSIHLPATYSRNFNLVHLVKCGVSCCDLYGQWMLLRS